MGYNYANFKNNSLEYMDSMWFFATWLANQAGAVLTKLPFGDTVLGLNVYTALFVSFMAVGTFLFCVYRLKMPEWIAFAGEILACSLCWAPTAVLYHYLTYLFLLAGCILIYQGLECGRDKYLLFAGILLGLNVAVRFSNLTHMGMILVVWGYAAVVKKSWRVVLKETGNCVLGYVIGLGGFLLFMSLRYGFTEYFESVMRLFEMTEVATDYSPMRMLLGMVQAYFDCSYWLKRFGLMLVVCTVLCLIVPGRWKAVKKGIVLVAAVVLLYWLAGNNFYLRDYAIYQSIYYPCVALFALAILLSVYFLARKGIAAEDKLKALFVIILILIGTLGSNNAMYSGINNTFMVLPFVLYLIWKLCRQEEKIWFFPMKCVMVLAVIIVSVQALRFGYTFSYEEATGGRNMDTKITGIPTLNGMITGREKAESLTELYNYLGENRLRDKECILYGQIPAIAHYMELRPAMNIWSDLRSYGYEVMREDLEKVREEVKAQGKTPVVIMEISWAEYMQGKRQDAIFMDEITIKKLELIRAFLADYGYETGFENDKYVVFSSKY
ncbi:MAG: hypothetical protein E7287_01160 [Lachnospiraceae bacterium]|nr:hypothetical protein [Lachnospiraceae bacterium]